MMERSECRYEAIGLSQDGLQRYRCHACGHERTSRYPADLLHRLCPQEPGAPLPHGGPPITRRDIVGLTVQRAVTAGRASRSLEEVQATLDKCFGGCPQLRGGVCTYRGSECKHWQAWITFILLRDCDHVA